MIAFVIAPLSALAFVIAPLSALAFVAFWAACEAIGNRL